VHEHDAHVGAVAVRIDHDADLDRFWPKATATDSAMPSLNGQARDPAI
jgi:hypothetical protein